MPQVPGYQPQTGGPPRTPAVYVGDPRPDDSLGARSGQEVFNAAQEVGAIGQKINQIEVDRADELGMVADDLALSKLETDVLFNKDTGAMNLRGKNAFDAPKVAQDGWTKGIATIEKQAMTPRRRDAFLKNVSYRQLGINRKMNLFVSGEIQRYDDETLVDYVANMQREAIENWMEPRAAMDNISKIENALTAYADRNGKSRQWLELNIAKSQNQAHLGILTQMVEANQHIAAKAYFDAFGDQIFTENRKGVFKEIEAGRIKTQSGLIVEEALTDKHEIIPSTDAEPSIVGFNVKTQKGAQSYTELLESVRKDPRVKGDEELLRASEARAKVRWDQIKVDRQEAYNASYRSAQVAVEQTGSMDGIPRSQLLSFATDDIKKLEDRVKQIAANKEPQTKLDQLTHFFGALALPDSDPNAVSNWSEADVWKMRSVTDKDTFENKVLPKWSEAVEKKKNPAKIDAYRSTMKDERTILEGVKSSGIGGITKEDTMKTIEKSDDKNAGYWQFRQDLEDRAKAYHRDTGKNADDKKIQEFIDEISIEKARDWNKVVMLQTFMGIGFLNPNDEKFLKDVSDEDVKTEVFDIPLNEQARFYNQWLSSMKFGGGTPPSFDTFVSNNRVPMQRAWLAWKRGRSLEEQNALLLGVKK